VKAHESELSQAGHAKNTFHYPGRLFSFFLMSHPLPGITVGLFVWID
jgi:hypothetical protein